MWSDSITTFHKDFGTINILCGTENLEIETGCLETHPVNFTLSLR